MDSLVRVLGILGRAAVAIAGIVLVAACTTPPQAVGAPSVQAARQHLDKIIAVVESGDITHICDLGGPTCPDVLTGLAWERLPSSPPTVVDTTTLQPVDQLDGTTSGAGVLITLCGLDGPGQSYRSNMLIYFDQGRLVATEPIYWTGFQIAMSPVVGAPSPSPAACPSSSP